MTDIKKVLRDYKEGKISEEEALEHIMELPYKDLGEVKVDTFRELRKGLPEAVYCPGKSDEQLKNIAEEGDRFFSRASSENYETISSVREDSEYHEKGKMVVVGDIESSLPNDVDGKITVVTAGSSDIPIAEESAVVLDAMGYDVQRIFDVGVAGIHRLLPYLKDMRKVDAIIVAAGMDGTLPGIIAGLVPSPVIGVPTSVGYGTSEGGRCALETMLNSCSTGLAVVNIDNGYGAAAFVHHMLAGGTHE